MRLFFAVTFPDEIKRSLAALTESLRLGAEKARFTREENFHLTLSFLGETGKVEPAARLLDSFPRTGFSLTLACGGRFRRADGDVLFLEADGGKPLFSLQSAAARRLPIIGITPEDRPYRPHVTLARGFSAKSGFSPEKLLDALPPLSFAAGRVSLMSSETKKGRLVYTELAGIDLDG